MKNSISSGHAAQHVSAGNLYSTWKFSFFKGGTLTTMTGSRILLAECEVFHMLLLSDHLYVELSH